MAKILVLGATGFVGRHLVFRLKNHHEHQVSYLVRPTSKIDKPELCSGLTKKVRRLFTGDITDLNSLIKAAKNQDIIINLTTPTTQRDDINQSVIVEGTKNLIKVAKKNKIKKLIILSSAAGYRKTLDSYGKAKKQADKFLLKSKLNVIILKPTMIYGHGGYLFEKIKSAVTKIPFVVFMVGDGRYKIQPIFVEDMADAIVHSIEKPIKGVKIFDLGGPYPIECREFFKKILQAIHKRKIFIPIPVWLIIPVVKLINIFFKNVAWNKDTIKRMVEEIKLDVNKSKKELSLELTDYSEALRMLFSENKNR